MTQFLTGHAGCYRKYRNRFDSPNCLHGKTQSVDSPIAPDSKLRRGGKCVRNCKKLTSKIQNSQTRLAQRHASTCQQNTSAELQYLWTNFCDQFCYLLRFFWIALLSRLTPVNKYDFFTLLKPLLCHYSFP